MIVYKIKDNKIISISRQDANYQLQENEYSSDTWYLKPFFNGTDVVESITQAEIDERAEQEEKQSVADLLNQFERDGNAFYIEVRDLVRWHLFKGNITDTQYKAIRVTLEPALRPLKLGDWDIAQDNINAIPRPNGVLSQLYDFVKNKIDNYLS